MDFNAGVALFGIGYTIVLGYGAISDSLRISKLVNAAEHEAFKRENDEFLATVNTVVENPGVKV